MTVGCQEGRGRWELFERGGASRRAGSIFVYGFAILGR